MSSALTSCALLSVCCIGGRSTSSGAASTSGCAARGYRRENQQFRDRKSHFFASGIGHGNGGGDDNNSASRGGRRGRREGRGRRASTTAAIAVSRSSSSSGRRKMMSSSPNAGNNNTYWTSWELYGNGSSNKAKNENRNFTATMRPNAATSSTDEEISNYLPGFKDCPRNLKVAYQGEPGAYSEAAALTAYPDAEPFPCAVFEEAYEATESMKSDRSVLPFENSLGGSIHKNYDLILTHDLHVVGEVNFKVNHCLMALPGTKKENLTRAMSHPQALAQCDDYLTRLGVVKESAEDTAGSAKKIQDEKLENVAAVASERAAMLYGMEILDSKIQDDSSNVTRFLALAREPLPPKEGVPYKTSIVFANKDGPGSLFKALACFALRDINLTKIESRPLKTAPLAEGLQESMQFQYLFYVDFEASMAEDRAKNALRNLQEQTSFLRVLGSYPKDVSKF